MFNLFRKNYIFVFLCFVFNSFYNFLELQEENNILKSVWEKSKEVKVKQKRVASSKPRPKFTELEFTSKKGLLALKNLFDNYKVNDKIGPVIFFLVKLFFINFINVNILINYLIFFNFLV